MNNIIHVLVVEGDFLGYLREWEKSVEERVGYEDDERKRMTLSQETIERLRMSGNYFIINFCL